MYGEILKFGAQIVDALVEYRHPVFVYIPPEAELRGGAWVVLDPSINPDVMEMYADIDSRGGILEPAGIVEVKFRAQHQREMMHRLDERLSTMGSMGGDSADSLRAAVASREAEIQPVYAQIACEFADLHDRAGRMQAVNAIRATLSWQTSREFFYWRLRSRLAEQRLQRDVLAADPALNMKQAKAIISGWLSEASDQELVRKLEQPALQEKVKALHAKALQRRITDLQRELRGAGTGSLLAELKHPMFPMPSSVPRLATLLTRCFGKKPAAPEPLPGLLGRSRSQVNLKAAP